MFSKISQKLSNSYLMDSMMLYSYHSIFYLYRSIEIFLMKSIRSFLLQKWGVKSKSKSILNWWFFSRVIWRFCLFHSPFLFLMVLLLSWKTLAPYPILFYHFFLRFFVFLWKIWVSFLISFSLVYILALISTGMFLTPILLIFPK